MLKKLIFGWYPLLYNVMLTNCTLSMISCHTNSTLRLLNNIEFIENKNALLNVGP